MIGNAFGPVAWTISLLVLLPLALLAVWLVARYLGWLPEDRVWSDSTPVGNRITHRAEALVLLCVAAAIFVFTATNTSTGGRLLTLDQLPPGFATIHVLAAVAAGLGVLVGVLMALFGRTSTGVIFAAGVLCIYGMLLLSPEDIFQSLAPRDSTVADASLTFVRSAPDVEGAELYVNDVHLGTLPCEITVPKRPAEGNRPRLRRCVGSRDGQGFDEPRRFRERNDRIVGRHFLAKNMEAI
jgi:hypothetical protein